MVHHLGRASTPQKKEPKQENLGLRSRAPKCFILLKATENSKLYSNPERRGLKGKWGEPAQGLPSAGQARPPLLPVCRTDKGVGTLGTEGRVQDKAWGGSAERGTKTERKGKARESQRLSEGVVPPSE